MKTGIRVITKGELKKKATSSYRDAFPSDKYNIYLHYQKKAGDVSESEGILNKALPLADIALVLMEESLLTVKSVSGRKYKMPVAEVRDRNDAAELLLRNCGVSATASDVENLRKGIRKAHDVIERENAEYGVPKQFKCKKGRNPYEKVSVTGAYRFEQKAASKPAPAPAPKPAPAPAPRPVEKKDNGVFNNKKETSPMKKNLFSNIFGKGFEFGRLTGDQFKLSPKGIAIKGKDGYIHFDVATGKLTNVGEFIFDGNEMFFKLPTNKLAKGDLVIHRRGPVYITEVSDTVIKAVDPVNNEVIDLLPEFTLLGHKSFFTKVISLFDSVIGKGGDGLDNLMGNPLMLMLMSKDDNGGGFDMKSLLMLQMLGGDKGGDINSLLPLMLMGDGGFGGGDMFETIMMMKVFGGGDLGNIFGNTPAPAKK